ncbi:Flagellum site-determining protein YlxH [Planctomycetes bacterium Poly30]|uniref:Flagellum site-determining protein YlxH n=1 Tax=Saltatorellus ferox TaxID=2528018 RepID=A0A518ENL4_9BACT|nr:Flagellum site-determining protein YlxH [Planctomycetes bacterium Poly30]
MTRWDQARQLFGLGRRQRGPVRSEACESVGGPVSAAPAGHAVRPGASPAPRTAKSVCIASGKGGTGKSSISASLAALFVRRGPTLLLDGDLGCANAHILQDAQPRQSFANVIAGEVGVADIVTPCKNGVDLLAGGSGLARLAGLKTFELEMIGRGLDALEPHYEHLVVDSAAGLSRQTVAFAVACDATVIVTTPDVTAMTDAYAFLKVFVRQCEVQGIERPMPFLVVNRASSHEEAASVARRLEEVVFKFLGRKIELIGELPEDRAVFRASQRRRTVVEDEPEAEVSRALQTLSNGILSRLSRVRATSRAGLGGDRSAGSSMGQSVGQRLANGATREKR